MGLRKLTKIANAKNIDTAHNYLKWKINMTEEWHERGAMSATPYQMPVSHHKRPQSNTFRRRICTQHHEIKLLHGAAARSEA